MCTSDHAKGRKVINVLPFQTGASVTECSINAPLPCWKFGVPQDLEKKQLKLFGLFHSTSAKSQAHPSEHGLGKLRNNLIFSEAENIQSNENQWSQVQGKQSSTAWAHFYVQLFGS